jgi:hypothetical protein
MRDQNTPSTLALILTLSVALALSACNLGAYHSAATPGGASGTATLPPGRTAVVTLTPPPTVLPSPTPDLPTGWSAYSSPELGLTLYVPAGWEAVPATGSTLDLWERSGGQGWMEISPITEASTAAWGFTYQAGTQAEGLMDTLVASFGDDGEFEAHRPILTRDGRTARVAQGIYHVYDEELLIGAIALADRAIIIRGHGVEESDNRLAEWARLLPIYEQIVWSITPQP